MKETLTAKEFAAALRISYFTLIRKINSGDIKPRKIAGMKGHRFFPEDVDAAMTIEQKEKLKCPSIAVKVPKSGTSSSSFKGSRLDALLAPQTQKKPGNTKRT